MEPTPLPNLDADVAKVPSPARLAHVVLRTPNLKAMEEFYTIFLGGHVTYSDDKLSFITYDGEHHRVALVEIPDIVSNEQAACGLEHVAFTFSTLHDLMLAYRARKERGIYPFWSVNHGPTTSVYYKDPDGNKIETQVDNFDTVEEAVTFMSSHYFAENPIGTEFDPDEMIVRLRNGEDEKILKKRTEIGSRSMPDLVAM